MTLLVAGAILFFTFTLPAFTEIRELRGEREALISVRDAGLQTSRTVDRLLAEFSSVSSIQRNISLALPAEEEVPGVINQLQGIAKLSGVVIESLDIELLPIRPVVEGELIEPVGKLRITIGLLGNYEGIKSYLSLVETNIRVIDVSSIRVDGGTESSVLKYNIVVDTYYQR